MFVNNGIARIVLRISSDDTRATRHCSANERDADNTSTKAQKRVSEDADCQAAKLRNGRKFYLIAKNPAALGTASPYNRQQTENLASPPPPPRSVSLPGHARV